MFSLMIDYLWKIAIFKEQKFFLRLLTLFYILMSGLVKDGGTLILASASDLVQYMLLIEEDEENLASHAYVVRRGGLICGFSGSSGYLFFLAITTKLC